MKKILILVLALLFTGINYADNKHFDTMVFFGDSLSDNGNLYKYLWHVMPTSPPYYKGRFSNGPVWSEQIYRSYFPKKYTEGMQNYAVGGSGAVLSYKQYFPYTLIMELDNYLYWHTYGKKESTLYTIWTGGNNYLNGPKNVETITTSVVDAIGDAVERLIKEGGNKFLIPNLPDISRSPYSREHGTQALVHKITLRHNTKLAAKVEELKNIYPDVTIVYFDVYTFFANALDHSEEYDFSKVDQACYLGGFIGWLAKPTEQQLEAYFAKLSPHFKSSDWESIKNNPQLHEAIATSYVHELLPLENQKNSLYCDDYVFWDTIHPSTKAHAVIAEKAREVLDEAGLTAFIPKKG